MEPGENRGFDDAEEQEMRSCCCPSCGAELVCDHATIAASCPYCDNPTVIRSRVAGALRPDLVIPFKLEKDAAVAALKKHYVKRPLSSNPLRYQQSAESGTASQRAWYPG